MSRLRSITKTSQVSFLLVLASLFAAALIPSNAAAESHCTYSLHSSFMKKNFRVCQMVSDKAQCGTWKVNGETTQMAFAVSDIELVAGTCSVSGMVGTCELPSGDLVFYEGNPAVLELGCYNMKGIWQPKRLGVAQELKSSRPELSPTPQ